MMRPLTPTCGNRAANVSEFDDACALTGVRDAGGAVAQQHAPRAALSRRRLRRRHRVAREVASWCQGVRSAGATTARWRRRVVKWHLVRRGRIQHVTNRTSITRAPDALWCMIRRQPLRWVFCGVKLMARRPPNDGASWSARELVALRALAKSGTPTGQVARKLGRTAAAVQQKAMRAGISFRAAKRSAARRKK